MKEMTKFVVVAVILLVFVAEGLFDVGNPVRACKSGHNGLFADRILHLYKEQFEEPGPFYEDFLKSYENFFSNNARQRIAAIPMSIDMEVVQKAACKIDTELQKLYREFSLALSGLRLPKSILFVGDMVTDGHGIRVNQSWYLFIDLHTIVAQQRHKGEMKWFLAHELAHAIHYSISPEFFKDEYVSEEDSTLKLMIAEGIATWVSMKICAIPENQAFWGDFLDDSQILKWRQYAAENKPIVAGELERIISDKGKGSCSDLNNLLFNVLSMDNLEKKRTGYLYGYEIVSKLAANKTMHQLLKTPYGEMRPHILDYFSISPVQDP